jgi:hypothetical protein
MQKGAPSPSASQLAEPLRLHIDFDRIGLDELTTGLADL